MRQPFTLANSILVGGLMFLSAGNVDALFVTTTPGDAFPTTAEVVAATPAQATFGDDASTSLGQSFSVASEFLVNAIFVFYENDTRVDTDQTLTMTIFEVADVQAPSHDEPPLPANILLTESVTFPYVAGTDTTATILLDSPLMLPASVGSAGYMLHFSGTTNPGWEWLRTGSTDASVYAGGHAYENGTEKGSGAGARDFAVALSSIPEPSTGILLLIGAATLVARRSRG